MKEAEKIFKNPKLESDIYDFCTWLGLSRHSKWLEDHSHETANSTGDKRHGPGEMKCLTWWMEAIISWCESYWECSINKYSSSIVTQLSTRKRIENRPTASHYLKISFCFNIFHVWLKQSKMRVKGKTYLTSGLPCHIACEINFLCIINC